MQARLNILVPLVGALLLVGTATTLDVTAEDSLTPGTQTQGTPAQGTPAQGTPARGTPGGVCPARPHLDISDTASGPWGTATGEINRVVFTINEGYTVRICVKGTNANNTETFAGPVGPGAVLFSPDAASGRPSEISHWTIEILTVAPTTSTTTTTVPDTTTTTTVPDTTTTTTTTTTVPDTTTTVPDTTTTTVPDTTTTTVPDTTTTTTTIVDQFPPTTTTTTTTTTIVDQFPPTTTTTVTPPPPPYRLPRAGGDALPMIVVAAALLGLGLSARRLGRWTDG